MTTQESMDDMQVAPFDGIEEKKGQSPPAYFNILFYGLILWGVIFMGYYLFSGWSSHAEFQENMIMHQQQVGRVMQGRK